MILRSRLTELQLDIEKSSKIEIDRSSLSRYCRAPYLRWSSTISRSIDLENWISRSTVIDSNLSLFSFFSLSLHCIVCPITQQDHVTWYLTRLVPIPFPLLIHPPIRHQTNGDVDLWLIYLLRTIKIIFNSISIKIELYFDIKITGSQSILGSISR